MEGLSSQMPAPEIFVDVELAQEKCIRLRVYAGIAGQILAAEDLVIFVAVIFSLFLQRRVGLKFFHHIIDLILPDDGSKMLMPDFLCQSCNTLKVFITCGRDKRCLLIHNRRLALNS